MILLDTFNSERRWSKYQNAQFEVLQDIGKAFKNSLSASDSINNSLSKIEYTMTYIARDIVKDVDSYNKGLKDVSSNLRDAGRYIKDAGQHIGNTGKKIRDTGEEIQSAGSKFNQVLDSVSRVIWDTLGGLRGISQEVDKFSYASNQMIKLSGMSGDIVRAFREDIVSTVRELNLATGMAFSNQESYANMVTMFQGVTSDLEAMSEMARPLLLAQETLDINITNIAELFNKFYVRYNFSSTNMEHVLDEIRGNTAGNSADAAATAENMQKLESWINIIAGNDNSKREDMLEEISQLTSYLESQGLHSADYVDKIMAVGYGDWNSELIRLLNLGGITDLSNAQDMFNSGDFSKIAEALFKGRAALGEELLKSSVPGRALDNLGSDRDATLDAVSAMRSPNAKTYDEFLEDLSKTPMIDLTKDKYVSAADQITNGFLEGIYSKMAQFQDWLQKYLPIGFSDIALGLALLGRTGIFSRPVGEIGPTRTTSSIFSRMGGNLNGSRGAAATLSGIAGTAGVVGGLGLGVYGISEGIEDIQSGNKVAGGFNIAGGALGIAGAGSLGVGMLAAGTANAWNPVGWALLAASGITLLGTAIAKDIKKMSGNAEDVNKAFSDIEKSLESSRRDMISNLSELSVKFNETTDLEQQRSLLVSAGLATEDELQNKSTTAMQKLIDAYLEGAKQINSATETYLKKKQGEVAGEQEEQQEEFMKKLSSAAYGVDPSTGIYGLKDSESDRDMYTQIIEELFRGVTDEGMLKTRDKYLKDGKISAQEYINLTTDNKGIFSSKNFVEKSVSVGSMKNVVAAYGDQLGISDMKFTEWDQTREEAAASLLANFEELWQRFRQDPTSEILKSDLTDYINSMLKDENYNLIKDELGIYRTEAINGKYGLPEFANGTNYIPYDQVAVVHEGEAIVPKRYNPAANTIDTQAVAAQTNADREELTRINRETKAYFVSFVEELHEMREFLSAWKEDSEKNARLSEIRSKHESGSRFVSSYMTAY